MRKILIMTALVLLGSPALAQDPDTGLPGHVGGSWNESVHPKQFQDRLQPESAPPVPVPQAEEQVPPEEEGGQCDGAPGECDETQPQHEEQLEGGPQEPKAQPQEQAQEPVAPVPEQKPQIVVHIDKSQQEMTVAVDGDEKYRWPVSTGKRGYETPNGTYTATSMNEMWRSREWDNAPMPHAIFFMKDGHSIHGTEEVRNLGRPVSHGCVRLAPENATTLFGLVKTNGLENTTVVVDGEENYQGEAQVADDYPQSRGDQRGYMPPQGQYPPPGYPYGFQGGGGRPVVIQTPFFRLWFNPQRRQEQRAWRQQRRWQRRHGGGW
jgi:lipoprotein-anchoring transpeptidase ErfK/SrfK